MTRVSTEELKNIVGNIMLLHCNAVCPYTIIFVCTYLGT